MEETRRDYDWKRCDNLRWQADGESGRIRVFDGRVVLLRDTCHLHTNGQLVDDMALCCGTDYVAALLPKGFRIVPRDPGAFRDWQVGDSVSHRGVRYEVGLASGDIVVFFRGEGGCGATAPMTSEEAFRGGFRLLRTEYEEELAAECGAAAGGRPDRRNRTRPRLDMAKSIIERAKLNSPEPFDPDEILPATERHLVNLSRTGYIGGAIAQRDIDIERAWRLVAEDTRLDYEQFRQAMLAEFVG